MEDNTPFNEHITAAEKAVERAENYIMRAERNTRLLLIEHCKEMAAYSITRAKVQLAMAQLYKKEV